MSLTFRDVPLPSPAIDVQPRTANRWVERAARFLTVAAVAVAAILTTGAIGLALYGYSHGTTLYEGIEVAGVPVGGMTREDAAVAIAARFDRYAATPLQVEAAGRSFVVTPREAGARLDLEATLDRAFAYGREGSFWDRSARWTRALVRGTSIAPVIQVDDRVLSGQVDAIARQVDREPSDAYVAMNAETPRLVSDVSGVQVEQEVASRLLADRLVRLETDPVSFPTAVLPAAVPADRLQAAVPGAQTAVAAPLTVSAAEGSWSIAPEELREIVAVDEDGQLVVDRDRIEPFVQSIATTVNRPAVDADVRLNDDLSLSVVPGAFAATVDVGATVDTAVAALLAGEHDATVEIERRPPALTDADAEAAIARAEALIAGGIEVTWQGQVASGAIRLGRDDLILALVIDPRPGTDEKFSVVLNPSLMAEVIAPLQEEIDVPAVDAAFRLIDGQVRPVSEAKAGQELDLQAAAAGIVQAVTDGKPTVQLPVAGLEPKYKAADHAGIVVPHLLADAATYYGNSSDPRRQNVERAVALQHGWLVPPDGVFSYVEHLGRVDETNGFTTGFGIVADEERGGVTTAPVIGGGICQVSTTIFQAAFWAGLEIEERWQHPYWLQSYGQPPRGMKGLDAMVNVEDDWALDMKFRNTTGNWIAVVAIADGQNVTAQIFGTNPGWEVRVEGPILTNVVPKDDKVYHTESSELPAGQELHVETAAEGFDAEIRRTVLKNGQVIDEYVLTSSFAPSRNTILRGTGA